MVARRCLGCGGQVRELDCCRDVACGSCGYPDNVSSPADDSSTAASPSSKFCAPNREAGAWRAQRDLARDAAVALEQECAHLRQEIRTALDLLRDPNVKQHLRIRATKQTLHAALAVTGAFFGEAVR